MTFPSVEQRMVNTYLDTFPPFVPSPDGPETSSQEQFYRFMKRLYELLRDCPQLLVRELHPDDAYTNRFNKGADHKPKLRDCMRKMVKEIDDLIAVMFSAGQAGHVQGGAMLLDPCAKAFKKKHRMVLEQMGILFSNGENGCLRLESPESPRLFTAWVYLASQPGASTLAFSRCFFRTDYLYARDIYAGLLGNESAFHRLLTHLSARGYTAIANEGGHIALDVLNLRGEKTAPKCGFQYGVRFCGISTQYDDLVKFPAVLGLCIPCMNDLLTQFESLPPKVQAFMAERTRRCSSCGYCVQTDKTGKRPRARISVQHDGKRLQLCPYFPGYNYCWTELDNGLVDNLISMLDCMDVHRQAN